MPTTYQAAKALLRESGLAMPPVPVKLRPRLRKVKKWCYSSRTLEESPYEVREYVEEAVNGDVDDYVVIAHDGHGVNSWAIHYFLVYRPLLLFVRVAWGGVYTDPAKATATMNDSVDACRAMVGQVTKVARRKHSRRVLVYLDEFWGVQYCGLIDHASIVQLPEEGVCFPAVSTKSFLGASATDLPRLLGSCQRSDVPPSA